MNTTKVELPDGTLLKIEGGNAEQTAQFLAERCHTTTGPVANETPLERPGLTFEPRRQSDHPVHSRPVLNDDDEAPLALPALAFSKR